jgi:hypothetical protein
MQNQNVKSQLPVPGFHSIPVIHMERYPWQVETMVVMKPPIFLEQ